MQNNRGGVLSLSSGGRRAVLGLLGEHREGPGRRRGGLRGRGAALAVGETVILPHPPRPLVGVSIGMERECQQNDSLADG